MSAYFLFDNLKVNDPAALEEYKRRAAPLIAAYGGRYVVIGGEVELVEGSWRPTFPVMIEFPDIEHARRWYRSAEYRELKGLRLGAVESNGVLLAGLPNESEL